MDLPSTLGVSGKQPPPDRERTDQSPMIPQNTENLMDGGSTLVKHNIELMRQLIKHTESGNIRIRKLNEFRNLRRLLGLLKIMSQQTKKKNLYPPFHQSLPTSIPLYFNLLQLLCIHLLFTEMTKNYLETQSQMSPLPILNCKTTGGQ